MARTPANERHADVIIVGAGPAGSTAAYHLAQAGIDVLLLEKTAFPREKVCGDGFTPRATRQLLRMGIDLDEPGWIKNHGLRIIGGGHRIELPWPELTDFPPVGLVRTRLDFDELLAEQAQKSGAALMERTAVTGPIRDERTGRVVGVQARRVDDQGRKNGETLEFRAPLVIGSDGNSSRFALSLGMHKRDDRPMGVAVRTYYTSPRHDDDWLESWLELRYNDERGHGHLLPGYGWIFGVGDGRSNVGLGILDTSEAFGNVDYKEALRRWLSSTPEEWGFRDENMVGPIRGAALPMAFNRKPHYRDGVLLVGDAGGMINPFNGEGIAYAMEAAEIAAGVIVHALERPEGAQRERALHGYPAALDATFGGYYTLGRAFAKFIGNPWVMKYGTKHGLPRPLLMKFTLKLLANLTDSRRGDAMDRVINAMSKIAPAA
ncbi:MAG: geranylgeranyl reductase family protein [Propionibacteriales bacterium]|nr:geranylgeranyl reductase family protein [Propionibacteriales bacterium]